MIVFYDSDSSSLKYEPQHDKTNKMTCAHSEDWTQPGQPSVWSVFAVCMKKTDSNQTVRMHRLIWVFAGCTDHFVCFVMLRLNYDIWARAKQNLQNKIFTMEDASQPACSHSLIGVFAVCSMSSRGVRTQTFFRLVVKTDQTACIRRLIWVFAGVFVIVYRFD